MYKRQALYNPQNGKLEVLIDSLKTKHANLSPDGQFLAYSLNPCLLYTSDAADERSSVDLGGRRIINKKIKKKKDKKKIQE